AKQSKSRSVSPQKRTQLPRPQSKNREQSPERKDQAPKDEDKASKEDTKSQINGAGPSNEESKGEPKADEGKTDEGTDEEKPSSLDESAYEVNPDELEDEEEKKAEAAMQPKFKESKAKRAARKADKASRFSDLEEENRKRIEALQKNTPFCNTSDWQGGGCPIQCSSDPNRGSDRLNSTSQEEDRHGDEDIRTTVSDPQHSDPPLAGGQDIRREDTFATTGTTENNIIDSYHHEAQERRDEELMVPDVSHVMPLKYEDVRMRKGGGPCKKSLAEKVLRKKIDDDDAEAPVTSEYCEIEERREDDAKAKKVAKKAHNAARYSDLQSSTCTCSTSDPIHTFENGNEEESEKEREKDVTGCPVHDPLLRRKNLKEEEEREREELIRGVGRKEKKEKKEEKNDLYTGDGDDGMNGGEARRLSDAAALGTVGRDEPPPPSYEDVTAPPAGFTDRIRRKGTDGDGVVR
ncbi:MAG: hypothetical protein Q9169_005408, partial [Polycauliona sp. 2 TL-2023]